MTGGTDLKSLFEPRNIAFIGASTNVFKWGFNILHHLVNRGFTGGIFPVNPRGGEWFGRRVYTSLDEIPQAVDLAVIVVADSLVLDSIAQCAAKGIPAAIVITAGFSETGQEGARLERRVVEAARSGGMRIVGPNTMGVYSAYPSTMHVLMGSMPLQPGCVALAVQSGNLGTSISYRFLRRKVGISRLISTGNEADLTMEDFLEYLERDEQTRIICLYVEGLRRPRGFFETARRVSPAKPIVLIRGGRTAQGAAAALSHTGALAGDDAVFSAMCRQSGIIEVSTMDEMIDVTGMLMQPPMPGRRVAIITLGGGWGVLATDACAAGGLFVEPLSQDLVQTLDTILPPYWSRGNPIDLVAPSRVSVITDTITELMEHASVDAVLLMGLGYMSLRARSWMRSETIPKEAVQEASELMMEEEARLFGLVAGLIGTYRRPIVPVIDIMSFDIRFDNNPVDFLDSRGIMSYSAPDRAVAALAKAAGYHQWVRRTSGMDLQP
ncbi:MAG TPA: CoA-binding protein [Deltaproteobacteria bacterium]|nr:CoA-binding protein [Deltaproteobacteria bacterium]